MSKMLHTKALVVRESVGASQAGVIDQIIGSSAVLDRMGDIIDQGGWDLKNFNVNPVILWGHNVREERPPIGKSLKTWVQDKSKTSAKLMFKVQFDLADSFAADIYRKIKEGFINTVSVGFLPTEWEELDPDNWFGGLKYLKQELLELSFVPVPANPEALVGMRHFAEKDKRFTPFDLTKLYPPIQNKKDMAEILNIDADAMDAKDADEKAKKEKAQTIPVDPDSGMDNEGNVSGGNGGGGSTDNIENKPDGSASDDAAYDQTTLLGEITAGNFRDEMNAMMESCMPGSTKAKKEQPKPSDTKDNPKDPYQSGSGMGDLAEMPADTMQMKELTVGHARALMNDTMGDWQSNLSTTSNQDNANNYSFAEGDTKEQRKTKVKGLLSIIEKSGRVLSSKNETKVRDAVALLGQVLQELDKEETQDAVSEETPKAQEDQEAKGVIRYADHGKTPESESWDGPGEIAKADVADLKIMCSWFDSDNAENKSAYKLPHHKADGEHPSVWRGVAAAMASLLGARGGLDIPEEDRKGVYNHLKKHYAEYEKDIPDFKMVEGQVLAGLHEELLVLSLDREEKHVVRLIKKVLDNQKEEKKNNNTITPTREQERKALEVINLALSLINQKVKAKGGDETK